MVSSQNDGLSALFYCDTKQVAGHAFLSNTDLNLLDYDESFFRARDPAGNDWRPNWSSTSPNVFRQPRLRSHPSSRLFPAGAQRPLRNRCSQSIIDVILL